MNHYSTDIDNRTPEDVIRFLEAQVEALTKRVKELEQQVKERDNVLASVLLITEGR